MLDIEQIMAPISGDNPCGIDVEGDSRVIESNALIEAGTEEEPTEWKKVKKLCLEVLNEGRDVNVLVSLVVASTVIDGYAGLRDSLMVLKQSLVEYWNICIHYLIWRSQRMSDIVSG